MNKETMMYLAHTYLSAIKEAGEDGIPDGHLYAMVMHKISLPQHQAVIDVLLQAKLITNDSHLLKTAR